MNFNSFSFSLSFLFPIRIFGLIGIVVFPVSASPKLFPGLSAIHYHFTDPSQ